MELEGLFTFSQEHTTGAYPELDEFSITLQTYIYKGAFSVGFPT
jgi:hypothetical protein